MMNQPCPSKQSLRDFLEGGQTCVDSDTLIGHIGECSSCDQIVSEMENEQGAILTRLREGLRNERFLSEPEFNLLRITAEGLHGDMVELAAEKVTEKEAPEEEAPEEEAPEEEAPDDEFNANRRIRDYRLIKKIGEGGMGTVYQAFHVHLRKYVALKILSEDRLGSRISIERFRKEMIAVGKVNHPNVVSASDAGVVDGQYFLVMELVDGADLSQIIRRRGQLNIADACEIIRQAAIGLQHAHDNGLVHRDVKPSNLMLSKEGDVKLLDLGLAAVSHSDPEKVIDNKKASQLTSFGQIIGTLDYIAPEQISACSKADHRADIYSLGATLFALLTGKSPHKRESSGTPYKADKKAKIQLREIADFRNDLPQELCDLINKMLAKSLEERPQTATDVANELERFCLHSELGSLANECEALRERVSYETEQAGDEAFSDSSKFRHSGKLEKSFVGLSKGRAALVLATFLLISVVLFSVFTIKTKSGTLKIELPDGVDASSISVALEKDGKTVKIVDDGGNWEVSVQAGEYNIHLLKGDDKFLLDKQTLVIQAKETARLKVTWIPKIDDPVLLFRAGKIEAAAKLAEEIVDRNIDNGWNHVQAAMFWGALTFVEKQQSANRDRYDKHRNWLVSRWRKTGEGSNTIPRVCCLYPIRQAELKGMLEAVERESKVDPSDWRYPHTRMMLLYRMGRHEEALRAYRECRQISPTNRMHAAIDNAWSVLILRQLDRPDEGKHDHYSSAKFFESFRHPRLKGRFKVPEMWFDFIELGIIHRELDGSQQNESKEK